MKTFTLVLTSILSLTAAAHAQDATGSTTDYPVVQPPAGCVSVPSDLRSDLNLDLTGFLCGARWELFIGAETTSRISGAPSFSATGLSYDTRDECILAGRLANPSNGELTGWETKFLCLPDRVK